MEETIKVILQPNSGDSINYKSWLLYQFPEDKKRIANLSLAQKMEWYAHRFQVKPQEAVEVFSSEEFKSFWAWHVAWPLRMKRLFYRIKSGQIFKHYKHISEIRGATKSSPS